MLGDLGHLPNGPMLVAVVTAFLASIFVVWRLVGAAMRLLFFVVAFAVGYGFTFAFSELTGHPQPVWVYACDGLAFAWVLNLIRAKVARAITGLAVLGFAQVTGWFGFGHKPAAAPVPHPKKHASTHSSHPANRSK